jgi:hypothetical protein
MRTSNKNALIVGVIAALAGAGYAARIPAEDLERYRGDADFMIRGAWSYVVANPVPFVLAVGTFLVSVLHHKLKGKSLRESVEAAATRVTVVTVPTEAAVEPTAENPVLVRARARATRAQLLIDQAGLETRSRKLPEEITKAERDVCATQMALTDAEATLAARKKAHGETVAKMKALRAEQHESREELADIREELEKLAVLV